MTSTAGPRPLIDNGVVRIDSRNRTLTVRPASGASGTAKLLWRDSLAVQAATEAAGTIPRPYGHQAPGVADLLRRAGRR
jgi:hypothetical protein